MPIVTIKLIEGRTIDQKGEIVKRITETIKNVTKVPEDTIEIIFHDIKKENYSKGGKLFSNKEKFKIFDIDADYSIMKLFEEGYVDSVTAQFPAIFVDNIAY